MCDDRRNGSPSAWLLNHFSFVDFSLYSFSLACHLRLLTSSFDHVTPSLYLFIRVSRDNLIQSTPGQLDVGRTLAMLWQGCSLSRH